MFSDRNDASLKDEIDHSIMLTEHAPLKEFKSFDRMVNDDYNVEILTGKPAYGKRSRRELIIDLSIWFILTIYAVLLMIRGQGKDGYVLAILVYVFISLRLLARHVSMSILVYKHIGNAFSLVYGQTVERIPPGLRIYTLFGITFSALFLTALLTSIDPEFSSFTERIQSLFGVFVILTMMTVTSEDRSRIPWHTVSVGLFMQYLIAMFVLKTSVGIRAFQFLSTLITNFLETSSVGLEFLIGPYAHTSFAVNVLPAIIFFCAFISVVYYFGGMQYIVIKMAWFMMRLMDTSGSESVVAAASPFVGQGESALLVKPFVEYMTKSELHSTMTSGFATIAGSVLLAYIGFLDDASSLLCSCVMSIPASLLLSKMRYPEREESITKGEVKIPQTEEKEANFLHAAGNGSGTGIHLVLLICAALLAIVTLFTVCDQFVGWAFGMIEVYDFVNGPNPDGSMKPISIQLCLSYFFYPFAWLIGMPASDARKAGEIMAVKMVVNEFLAYSQLAELSKKHLLQPRSMLLY